MVEYFQTLTNSGVFWVGYMLVIAVSGWVAVAGRGRVR